MKPKRPHTTGIMVGRKATGKSTQNFKIASEYVTPSRRALIIDVNGSPAFKSIPEISIQDLATWKTGDPIRLAKIYSPDHFQMLTAISTHYRNGLLILEDCTKYIPANPPQAIKSLLVDNRMMGIDLLFTFHSLAKVPPFFWDLTDYVILKKTQDIFQRSDRLRYPNFPELEKAFQKVMASKDEFTYSIVETRI